MAEKRFSFGKNWENYISHINEENINQAKKSLVDMLGFDDFSSLSFLDIGSGSGIFSLSAFLLKAKKVFSFDYDEYSVFSTLKLKEKYALNEEKWQIEKGSVLDDEYIKKLGLFDIVYSWGVLHHTGNMYKAIENTSLLVKENGFLFIAIYNDQGFLSKFWKIVKRTYCSFLGKFFVILFFIPYLFLRAILAGLLKYKNPFYQFKEYKRNRGMSIYHDWIDWLGGYPFEVAKPKEIIDFLEKKNFNLIKLVKSKGVACNQFVFKRKQ